jgi:integrase
VDIGRLPGFKFDSRTKRAHFEVALPKTGGRCRRRLTTRATTRAEAVEMFSKWRASILNPPPPEQPPAPEPPTPTLGSYRKTWWPTVMKGLASKTQRHATWIFDGVLSRLLGDPLLAQINDAVIGDFVRELRSNGYAPASINGFLAVLRKILRDAVDRELIGRLPYKRRLPRQKENPPRRDLSIVDWTALLHAFDDRAGFMGLLQPKQVSEIASVHFRGPRRFGGGRRPGGPAAEHEFQRFRAAKPLFVVALETGLSQCDLLSLKWSSVDFTGGWLLAVRKKTGVVAECPISRACREALLECRQRAVVADHVFLTESARPYSVTTVNRFFRVAKKLAGIEKKCRFHDLRFTYASRLASNHVPPEMVRRGLGQKGIGMALHYGRSSDEALKAAIVGALDGDRQNHGPGD